MDTQIDISQKNIILSELKRYLSKYIDNPDYVFCNVNKSIIVLKKTLESEINEKEKNIVDPLFARHHTNVLMVVEIRVINRPWEKKETESDPLYPFEYNVGQLVKTKDHKIPYYKTVDVIFCNNMYHLNIDGDCITFYPTGSIYQKMFIKNGLVHGEYIVFNENGTVAGKCNYINGKIHGTLYDFYQNGSKFQETDYVNGVAHGKHIVWNMDGHKILEFDMECGIAHG